MDPLAILIIGPLAVLLIFAVALGWAHPRQGSEILGSFAEESDENRRVKRRDGRARKRRRRKTRKGL
jgi:uncharacterized membrane protein